MDLLHRVIQDGREVGPFESSQSGSDGLGGMEQRAIALDTAGQIGKPAGKALRTTLIQELPLGSIALESEYLRVGETVGHERIGSGECRLHGAEAKELVRCRRDEDIRFEQGGLIGGPVRRGVPKRDESRLGSLVAPAVDVLGEALAGAGEDLRDLAELLADDADPKRDLPVF